MEDFVPVKDPWFYILWALAAEGPLHGYGVMRWARELDFRPRAKMGPANTYPALFELADLGLIERVKPSAGADGRRSHHYRIMGDGAGVLEAQLRFMEEELRVAREILLRNGLIASDGNP